MAGSFRVTFSHHYAVLFRVPTWGLVACFCPLLPPPRPDHDHENDRDCNNHCNNFAGMGFEIEMFYF